MNKRNNQEGIALLVTLLLMGVLMGIGTSLANVTLRQYQISSIALASEIAFYAADAGVECIMYHDMPKTGPGKFDLDSNSAQRAPVTSLDCMDDTLRDDSVGGNGTCSGCVNSTQVESGEEQRFQFNWNNDFNASGGRSFPYVCTDVSIYKFYSTSALVPIIVEGVNIRPGSSCPQNGTCTVIKSRGYNVPCANITSAAKVVEREITRVY